MPAKTEGIAKMADAEADILIYPTPQQMGDSYKALEAAVESLGRSGIAAAEERNNLAQRIDDAKEHLVCLIAALPKFPGVTPDAGKAILMDLRDIFATLSGEP